MGVVFVCNMQYVDRRNKMEEVTRSIARLLASLVLLTALLKLNMTIICSAKLSCQRRRNQLLNMLQKKERTWY